MRRGWKVVLILSLIGNLGIVYVGFKAWEYRSHINEFLDKYVAVVDEFSQREYYRQANAALGEPQPGHPRVILFGTQVVARWPLLDSTGRFEIVNRGVPAQRAAGFLLRYKSDVLDLKPAAVVIELSSYNLRPQYRIEELTDYVVIMTELARLHGIEPILTTPVPLMDNAPPLENYGLADSLKAYSEWVRAFAAGEDCRLLDMGVLLADDSGFLRPDLAADAIDPNEQGYAVLTQALQPLLDEIAANVALKRPSDSRRTSSP